MAFTIAFVWRHLSLERSQREKFGGRVGNLGDASSSSIVCFACRDTSPAGQLETIDNENLIRSEILRVQWQIRASAELRTGRERPTSAISKHLISRQMRV